MRSASEQTVRGLVTVEQCIENATQCDEMAAATDHPDCREAYDNAAASWRHMAHLMTSIEEAGRRVAKSSLCLDGSPKLRRPSDTAKASFNPAASPSAGRARWAERRTP